MFCLLAFPLGGFIRNMNILLADILLVFILYISLYKGVPPHPAPPARAVDHSFLFSVIFDYSKYTLFQNKYSQLKSWRCIYLCIKSCTTLAKEKFWAFGSVRALFTVYWTVHVTSDLYSVPIIPNCKWSPDHKWSSTANDPLKSWIGMDFRDFRNGWWQERIFSLDSDW